MAVKKERKIKVAVVGTGMAGLVTAYLLSHDEQNRYAVTLFEKGERLALDYASVSVQDITGYGRMSRVDLPMRAFADGYYAQLKAMYDYIGVEYHAQKFMFAFSKTISSAAQNDPVSYFIHASNNHVFPPMRPRGKSLLRHLYELIFLTICYIWLTGCFFVVTPFDSEDFGQYLTRIRIPWYFVTHYILPLMCSVATCDPASLLKTPAHDVVNYKTKSHGAEHFVVSGGVHTVQQKLVDGLSPILNAEIVQIQPNASGVTVSWRKTLRHDVLKLCESFAESFDRVVLAVSPDIVGQIFDPLQNLMSRIPTIAVESSLLQPSEEAFPRLSVVEDSKREGKGRNGTSKPGKTAEIITLHSRFSYKNNTPDLVEAIHRLNNGARVTTCAFSGFHDREVLHRSRFTRVLRSVESRKILNGIFQGTGRTSTKDEGTKSLPYPSSWHNGDGNVWLAGGWCWDGMVLLEGCIVSAMRIAEDFDVNVPWLAGNRYR